MITLCPDQKSPHSHVCSLSLCLSLDFFVGMTMFYNIVKASRQQNKKT